MAKAEKMNRGMKARTSRGGGQEIRLPDGVHSLDAHGNIFASLPELSRVQPKYFTFDQIKEALDAGKLTTLSEQNVKELETLVGRG
jgi:hypothetical protein